MKPSYISNLMSSFYLWLDHELLHVGQGFSEVSGSLYPSSDSAYNGYTVYSSPYRQWVSDSSISGAYVPSGVFISGQFVPKSDSLKINYNKGEVLFSGNAANYSNITTRYNRKDFNIYYTDDTEQSILFEKTHTVAFKFGKQETGLRAKEQPIPCIFLKNTSYDNKPFSFGGQEKSLTTIRAIVLSDNIYLLDAAISVMADSVRKVFPVVEPSKLPYDYYGDIKTGGQYKYSQLTDVQNTNLVYIDRVSVSRMEEMKSKDINMQAVAAIVDFDLWQGRYPRVY